MKPTVFVYGPKGCGKTRNAERLRVLFGLDLVMDEWTSGSPCPPAWGALVLTNLDGAAWAKTRGYAAVEYSSVVSLTSSERRERIATAVLAGIFAGNVYDPSRRSTPRSMASNALEAADALIAELDK